MTQIHGLQDRLSGGRIVWTGSESALRTHFTFDDVQSFHGYGEPRPTLRHCADGRCVVGLG